MNRQVFLHEALKVNGSCSANETRKMSGLLAFIRCSMLLVNAVSLYLLVLILPDAMANRYQRVARFLTAGSLRHGCRREAPMDDGMDTSLYTASQCAIIEVMCSIILNEVSTHESYNNQYRFGKICFSSLRN